MNQYIKIKFALDESPEDLLVLAEKFLCCEKGLFTLVDLYWWWDSKIHWSINLKPAKKLLQVLLKNGCCIRVSGTGGWVYKVTETFLVVLGRIVRVENILRGDM